MTDNERLADFLAKGPQPSQLRSQAGGAALALALHCLMVRDGFEPVEVALDSGAVGRQLTDLVTADWNSREDFWVFEYTRPGAVNKFRLQCSLQAHTRRMFVHASEVDSTGEAEAENMRVMGLQVDNYVPNGDRCSSSTSWDGVMHNERALSEMFEEFVGAPLWRHAEKLQQAGRSSLAALSPQQRTWCLAAAMGASALAAGLLLWQRQPRRT